MHANFANKYRGVIKGKYKATIEPLIEAGKEGYIWSNLQPKIEVSEREI
jgi:hypothetical protein